MTGGTINDITNLKFYSDNGYEIQMLKQYILTWEIIPSLDSYVSSYVKTPPSGYFIADVDVSDPANIKIAKNSMQVGFINNGEVFVRYGEQYSLDKNGKPIFAYNDDHTDELKNPDYTGEDLKDSHDLFNYMYDMLFNFKNEIKIMIAINGKVYSNTYPVDTILDISLPISNYEKYLTRKHVYTGNNLDGNREYYNLIGLKYVELALYSNGNPAIQNILELNIPNIASYFPFVQYTGEFYQEKISAGFIAANTFMVLEENKDDAGNICYQKPYITSDNEYSLVFLTSKTAELSIISPDSLYDVKYVDERAFSLADKEVSSTYVTPFSFAIGFYAEVEGAYQNFLGMYMRSQKNPNIGFFIGAITIKTEVEGEDERFRTLLGNFGVIDPIKYPNLFAEQDFQEEGKDYVIINKKSKELMLTYDQIFSYVGTYKALLNAIKFLGYTDIIFKEWYTIKDSNDRETDVAVQIFDTESGNYLKLKLASYGISIEDFKSYNKINKLSMIYHLNEIDENNYEYINQHLVQYKKATYNPDGTIKDPSTMVVKEKYTKLSEVPLTKPIYEYRNEETLAKLFGVKKWLDDNIIGVNAYISDISGEGIYFGWQKSLAYATQHYLKDFSQELYYTADVKKIGIFKNSSVNIDCTLTELNNSVKFCEYENTPIEAFDRHDTAINMEDINGIKLDVNYLSMSNSIEAPVLGDEYEFDLEVSPEYGTLYEWTKDGSSQILYNTGELSLLFEKLSEAEIDSNCLPIITLENANIHNCYGSWTKNMEWTVKETIDQSTGNIKYRLKNFGTYRSGSYTAYDNNYFVLVPNKGASIKYTENNKYHLPMLIIKGYEFDPILNKIDPKYKDQYTLGNDKEYILEILKGDILFKEVGNVAAQLSFSTDNNYINNKSINTQLSAAEQEIYIKYTYKSEKKPFVIINDKQILNDIEASTNFDYSAELQEIDKNQGLIDSYYDDILKTRIDFISNPTGKAKLVANKDASTFIHSLEFIKDELDFLSKKKEQMVKSLLYNDYVRIYNNNYTFNSSISTNVNRLGNYSVTCRAYDKYNNIFINKYSKSAKVMAKPISIDLYTAQSNSNNSSIFYQYNLDGELCDSDTIKNIIKDCDSVPAFPKSYHIADFDYDPSLNRVEFDNISYAIDTPKNNDYVIFDNLSEVCSGAVIMTDADLKVHTRFKMVDENPNRVYLYNPSTYINVVIYDKVEQHDYANIGPLLINDHDSFYQETGSLESYLTGSYIIVDSSISDQYINAINDIQRYATYMLNVTEYTIDSSNVIISSNYNDKETTFIFTNHIDDDGKPYQIFNNEDVIKIRYYIYETDNMYKVINETSYRIININEYESANSKYYAYTINGLINEFTIDDPAYKVVMTYANHNAVHYVSRVIGDAKEYNYGIGNGNYILRDRFTYDSNQMLLNDYIDDTYSGIIYDYDGTNLKKTWFDASETFDPDNMELFYYHNFPISIKQGKLVTLHHHDIDNVFKPGYHISWKASNYVFDENANHYYLNNSETIFRSINDYLTFKPEYIGPQNIELECIDIYGNRLVNNGHGLIYVNKDPNYTNK